MTTKEKLTGKKTFNRGKKFSLKISSQWAILSFLWVVGASLLSLWLLTYDWLLTLLLAAAISGPPIVAYLLIKKLRTLVIVDNILILERTVAYVILVLGFGFLYVIFYLF